MSAAEHRYLMTVVATASNPRFEVSRVDIDRDGPTYTIDTLRELSAAMPDADLYFITGADAMAQILTWRDPEELFELAHFVGCTRPGHELNPNDLDGPARRPHHAGRDPRPGHLLHRVPQPRGSRASRSGTSCPTASSSTSASTSSTESRSDERRRPRHRAHPGRGRGGVRQARAGLLAFDVSEQLAITDVFLLCSAANQRRCGRSRTRSRRGCSSSDAKPVRREGEREGRWVLLDFSDIVVHIQHSEERAYYALERLWSDCPLIDLPRTVR